MNLILFFNGWGMDDGILKNLTIPEGFILKEVSYPYKVDIDISQYSDVYFIGWSFGCWYLTKYLIDNSIKTDKAIAINGHSKTIGKYGIAPKMFNFTLDTLTYENLLKFYENMGIDRELFIPKRDFNSIKNELEIFGKNYKEMDNIFNFAFVGENDRIIPGKKQIKYWKENGISPYILQCEHYPFIQKDIFNTIIKRVQNELSK